MSEAFLSWLCLVATSPTPTPEPTKLETALEFMNGNPYIGWGMIGFGLLATAIAAIATLMGNLTKISENLKKLWPFEKAKITDEQRNALLQDLNKVVLKEVTERLAQSLHHRIQMDLSRELQMQRVGRVVDPQPPPQPPQQLAARLGSRLFNPFSASPAAEASAQPIADSLSTRELFEHPDIHGRLLILGEPGAGKTTELLALTKDLLQQAQQASGQPIPIIFELSAWSSEPNKELADWFVEQLKANYDIPPEVSKPWIDDNKILPLLDGLDELRRVEGADGAPSADLDPLHQAQQIRCIRDINTYLDTHPQASLVVCCRRKEYEALEQQGEKLWRLKGAIYLQALSDEQIAAYFEKPEHPHLWTALKEQPELLELARSPLFLLMLLVVYQGQTIQNQGQTIQSKEQLLDAYIDKQLADLNNQGAYPPGRSPTYAQTHHYLSWLALKLKKKETTEFLIENLQPSWLDRKSDRLLYIRGVGLMFGLMFGLTFGLFSGLFSGLIIGLMFGLVFGQSDINFVEKLTFSWQQARIGLSVGLTHGLIIGLISGLIGELIFELSGGLRSGLTYGLIIGLSGGLVGGLRGSEVQIREKKVPNQAFWRSWSSALIFGLLGGLIFGLLGGLLGELISGLLGGLLGGLIFGLSAAIQHVVLRTILLYSGSSPRNYKLFMEHAENHRFILRVGGRYRFVHDLLRTRFAERYQPQYRRTKA